jgi:hypothetical protein
MKESKRQSLMYTLRINLEIDPLVLAEAAGLTLDEVYVALKHEPIYVHEAEAIVDAYNQFRIGRHSHVYTLETMFAFCPRPFYA